MYRQLTASTVFGTFTVAVGAASAQVGSALNLVAPQGAAAYITVKVVVGTVVPTPTGTVALRVRTADDLNFTSLTLFTYDSATPALSAALPIVATIERSYTACAFGSISSRLLMSTVGFWLDGTTLGGSGTVAYTLSYTLWGA